MKIFISQPMFGKSDEEILKKRDELFALARERYGDDITLIDSFSKDPELVRKGRVALLGDSISQMAEADLVVFDALWFKARGCRVEHFVAKQYSIPILFAPSGK